MKTIRDLACVFDRLRLMRRRQPLTALTPGPMSDQELAAALRELRGAPGERTTQKRISAMAELQRLQHWVKEQDSPAAERWGEALTAALAVLRDPAPDTFLGHKAQKHLGKEDES